MTNFITAQEARENVKEHDSCATLQLVSNDKGINTQKIFALADEAIRQASSDGLSKVAIILSSTESMKEILDFDDILFVFAERGYIIKWSDETIGRAEGIVGQHIMSLKIEW